MTTNNKRSLDVIAAEIFHCWRNVGYAAKPYLQAMLSLRTVDDMYGAESGKSIVTYFLSNAGSWRGDDARRIKAELKGMI